MATKISTKETKENVKKAVESGKDLALRTAIDQIEKSFGKGSIMKLGGTIGERSIPVIPTGSIALDLALGVGGVPRGRIVEIFGPESSGMYVSSTHHCRDSKTWRNSCFNRRRKCLRSQLR